MVRQAQKDRITQKNDLKPLIINGEAKLRPDK
jgi:hypothetical protein